jgi:plasmid stabilization system protein ParE
MIEILLSDLAVDQLKEMPANAGRQMLDTLQRLRAFPESAPPVLVEGYEAYRQIVIRPFRAIYHYLPEKEEVRVYCILHTRRRLPPSEFLEHQIF